MKFFGRRSRRHSEQRPGVARRNALRQAIAPILAENLEQRCLLSAAPVVLSINRSNPSGSITSASSVTYAVAFSESVTGVDPTDFSAITSGSVTYTNPVVVSGSGSSYNVTINGIAGSGTLGLNLVDSGSIRDAAGNPLAGNFSFQNQQTFTTGTKPRSIATADLNADGKLDLIVANQGSNNVDVFWGNGNGTFSNQQTLSTGNGPVSVAVADVNGDGKPDVLVANYSSNNLSVLLGNGNGTFQPARTYATGVKPAAIAAVDLNADGRFDLIVANQGSNNVGNCVGVLLGNGDGTFAAQQTFGCGARPRAVTAADVNGDGIADLIVGNYGGNSLSLLLGNGNGTFATQRTLGVGSGPNSIVAADVNRDGNLDLLTADVNSSALSLFLGNGNGTFSTRRTFATGSAPQSLTVADVNGDGNPDLFVANETDNNLGLLLGNGNGSFSPQQTIVAGLQPIGLTTGDFNADGRTDLALSNSLDSTASVFLNSSNGNFTGQIYTISAGNHLAFSTPPANTFFGSAISVPPGVQVSLLDTNGNVITSDNSTVTLTLNSGTFSGGGTTASIAAASGIATFNNLVVNAVGSYTLTATDGAYKSITSTSFTITQATPMVNVSDVGGTYTSSAFPATTTVAGVGSQSTPAASLEGVSPTLSYYSGTYATYAALSGQTPLAGPPVNAGDYTVASSFAGSTDYTSAVALANFTIAQATLTVSAAGQNEIYDGTTAATITLSDNHFNGDSITDSFVSATFANKNVGNGKTITVNGISLSGTSAANYTLLSTSTTTTANITARTLSVTASGINKIYDGITAATVTLSDNRISGDTLTTSYVSAAFTDKNIGTSKSISVSGINVIGTDAGNYTFNTTATAAANITVRSLTLSATGVNKIYDGTTAATASLSDNRAVGDTLTVTYSAAAFADKNVATGKPVTVSGISVSGADFGNYVLVNTTASTTASITARSLTVSATGVNKMYDGATAATVTLSDNRVSGDTLGVSYGFAFFGDKNVGIARPISISAISVGGADAGNYVFNSTAAASANITQRTLHATPAGQNKIYDATTAATVGFSDDRVAGDVLTESYTSASFTDKNVGTNKPVTASGFSISGTDAANYILASTSGSTTANITPRTLTVSAAGVNKVYDATTTASVTLSDNRLSGDQLTDSYVSASFTDKSAGSGKTINVLGIGISGADSGNYTWNSGATALGNITPRTLSVTSVTAVDKVYDGTPAASLSFLDNRLNGDSLNEVYIATFPSKTVGSSKSVSYTVTGLSGPDGGSYVLTPFPGATTASITPLTLVVNALGQDKIYDGTTVATISLTDNRATGDTLTETYTAATFSDKNAGSLKTVSVSGISVSGTDFSNYTLSNTTASTTADITPRSLTITATGANKLYDASINSTVTLSDNRLAGDTLTTSYTTAAFADKNVGAGKTINVSGVNVTGTDVGNYTFSPTTTATANITARSLTVTVTGVNKIYDGTTVATVNFSDNRLSGDTLAESALTTFASKTVGTSKTISVSGISISGIDAGNYILTNTTAGTSANITARPLTVSAAGVNKSYDATTSATVTLSDNRVAGDTLTDSYTAAAFADKNVGTTKTINVSGIGVSGTDFSNYTLTSTTASAAASITPELSIAGTTSADSITLMQDADRQDIDWFLNGSSLGQLAISDPSGLSITGNGGTDVISLNNTNASPLPATLHINGTFTINGLSASNPLANTTLEIGRSTVYINYSGQSPLSLIQGYLKNGYNNGAWNGTPTSNNGVITSIAAAQNAAQTTAISYADSADGLIAGQPANTIELKYTLYGDTTLSGSVGFNNFTRLTQHYNQTSGGTWDIGDFNYDSSVNLADFALLSRTYNTNLGAQAQPAATAANSSSNVATSISSPGSATFAPPGSAVHRHAGSGHGRKHKH